jgi:hypothetical protein
VVVTVSDRVCPSVPAPAASREIHTAVLVTLGVYGSALDRQIPERTYYRPRRA